MRHAKLQQSGSQVKFEADGRLEAGAWRTSEIKVTRDEDSTEYRVTTRGQMDQPDTLKVRVDHETGLMDVGGYYLGGLPARIKEESRWNF